MTHPTVAICISGQIRSLTEELLKTAEEARIINADVFISIWSKRGEKTFEGAVGPKNIRRIIGRDAAQLLPDNWLGRMREVFPESSSYFSPQKPITLAEIKRVFPNATIEIEEDGPELSLNAGDSNSLRMLYKIWRANQLKSQSEKDRGTLYDIVVRVRPDLYFNGPAIGNLQVKPDDVFVQGHVGKQKNYINDTIWVASSKTNDTLCTLYHRCVELKDQGWKGIHFELSKLAQEAGINPQAANIVKGGLGDLNMAQAQPSTIARDNLLKAVISKNLNIARAGGDKFCELVSKIVAQATSETGDILPLVFSSESMDILSEIQHKNFNAYYQSIIYLSNICLLDSQIPATDRAEIMFRVISYYCMRNAAVYLDVRISELPELFEKHPVALQQSICLHTMAPQPIHSELVKLLASKWDAHWENKIPEDPLKFRTEVQKTAFSTPKFVIDLHQILSKSGHHASAFQLAEKWVEFSPNHWRSYDLKAGSAQAMDQLYLALSIYEMAEKNAAPHARIQEVKAKLLVKMNRLQEARNAFKTSQTLPECNQKRVAAQLANVEKLLQRLE